MSDLPGEPMPEKKERGDLDDPKKVGRRASLDRIQEMEGRADVAFVLSSVQGRRFYWRLMRKCGIFESSFTGNNTTFFNEGMRNIGLMLIKDVNDIAPEAYLQMLSESKMDDVKRT